LKAHALADNVITSPSWGSEKEEDGRDIMPWIRPKNSLELVGALKPQTLRIRMQQK